RDVLAVHAHDDVLRLEMTRREPVMIDARDDDAVHARRNLGALAAERVHVGGLDPDLSEDAALRFFGLAAAVRARLAARLFAVHARDVVLLRTLAELDLQLLLGTVAVELHLDGVARTVLADPHPQI